MRAVTLAVEIAGISLALGQNGAFFAVRIAVSVMKRYACSVYAKRV
jgi:hypothetical protein